MRPINSKKIAEMQLTLHSALHASAQRLLHNDVQHRKLLCDQFLRVAYLQALLKHLQGISDEDIPGVQIPVGIPIVCELDDSLNLVHDVQIKE